MDKSEIVFADLFADPPRNGIYKSKEFLGRGTKLVRMKELFAQERLDSLSDDFELIELSGSEASRVLLSDGDLLFSRTSVKASGVGKCCLVQQVFDRLTFDSNIIRVRLDKRLADPAYYFYYFNSNHGRNRVLSLSSGSAVTTITGTGLSGLTIPFPPLETQRQIAGILSAYDDLIENNTRRIRILEEMAQSLYREWFVHFRYPGHEHVPLVESSAGPIPEGWEMRPISSFGKVVTGKTPSKKQSEFFGGDIPFIKIPDIRGNVFVLQTEETLSDKGSESQRSQLLPAGSICASCIGTIGLVSIATQWSHTNQQINSLIPTCPHDYAYLYLAVSGLRDLMQAHGAGGATMGNLSKGKFSALEILYPPELVSSVFSSTVEPIFEQMRTLNLKNIVLRTTHERLLPALLEPSSALVLGASSHSVVVQSGR